MMEIKTFVCNMLEENCYVVSDETKECVIIDCGAFYGEERDAIVRYIDNNQLKPVHLLATHGHLDHNFGNNTILEHYGLKPEVAEGDRNMMNNYNQQAQKFYGMQLNFELPEAGSVITDNQDITFGNHKLKVIPTPGHSKGSVTFYCKEENVAFTGDTLFQQSIGRTDLHGGSRMQIIQSLRILAQLPDETVVKPGHGNDTTIGRELESNPFMER